MEKEECDHSFTGFEYSKLVERWLRFCPKCGLVNNEPIVISERLKRARKSRIRNGDIKAPTDE